MSSPSSSTRPPERPPLRVLVADDEPLILQALQRYLELRGYVVRTAPDAYGALALLEAEPFDAVLVDQRMPGGGLSVLEHLRDERFAGARVLMTGGVAADPVDMGEDVCLLQKPFSFASVIPLLES